jgi:hypothetical protein|tara:strand:- start:157 stop:330 length:174 start_codon:yes stop_codon:yes gene_type:complete
MEDIKSIKYEAQKIRIDEENKLGENALRAVLQKTREKLQNDRTGSNGLTPSDNLIPA